MNLSKNIVFLQIILLTLFIKLIYCTEKCTKMNVLVTGNVENEGYHRDIKWLIELGKENLDILRSADCKLALKQDIPAGLYASPDQIDDLIRVGKLHAVVLGNVNVETPMHLSEPHIVFIYNNHSLSEKIPLELPVHLRYQRAQITGGYGKVEFPSFSLLIRCQNDLRFCGRNAEIDTPCSYDNKDVCIWQNISYQDMTNDIEMLVPIGDLDHYPLVSIVTLLVACAGCIYILSILSTTVL